MTRELFVLIVTCLLWLSLLLVRRIKNEDARYGITTLISMIASIMMIWLFLIVGAALPTAFPGGK